MSRVAAALAVLLLAVAASADEAWETETRTAVKEQDRQIEEARGNRSLGNVAARYTSRLDRNPTALGHYLAGRALFHADDAAGAERHLKKAIEVQPNHWFARVGLGMLAAKAGDLVAARRWLDEAARLRPNEPEVLRARANLAFLAKDWDGAVAPLRSLVAVEPANEQFRGLLIEVYAQKKDWAAALTEIEALLARLPGDRALRLQRAQCWAALGRTDQAIPELESLAGLSGWDPQRQAAILDMLRLSYVQKRDEKGLIRTFERMLPLARDAKVRAELQETIDALKQGAAPWREPPPRAPVGPPRETADQEYGRIVGMCLDETDAEKRREGLRLLYGLLRGEGTAEHPTVAVPVKVMERRHPVLEPDAVCRAWVMRILGKAGSLGFPRLSLYASVALYDPDPDVRRTSAEALGEIGAPSGLVYLRPYFFSLAHGPDATEAQVREFNAARLALVRITKHEDVPGALQEWLGADRLDASRADWGTWLRSPEGSRGLVAGIADLEALGETCPEYCTYNLVDLMQEPDTDVSRAAYMVLRRRSAGPPAGTAETDIGKAMWPRFPRVEEADLNAVSLPGVRKAVEDWWLAWTRMREEKSRAEGSPDGAGSK